MQTRNRFGRHAATAAACIAVLGLAQPASAHVDPPTVTALHAFVGDPLWGLDTPEGSLYGILPDERTAMASTTKVMTLDLAVEALNAGVVLLNDQVTIDALEAAIEPPNSVMADVNGVTLDEGEVVSFETLLRGMMYPSGNDAAWAVGHHIAQAYLGAAATDQDFIPIMNQHAADLGLVDTHYTSANGWDDPSSVVTDPADYNHYTTARELAKLMAHAIQDPYFQQVVGFQGTYTDTTTGAPSGVKTYSFSWGFTYPGWEGAKGGGTQNCNGPNNGCMVMSAKRIGRRVVEATMQGQPWNEDAGIFDFAFATIFHPDARGTSAPAGATADLDVTCLSDGRVVSAVIPQAGDVRLVSWKPDIDLSSITKLAEATLPKSAVPPKKNGQGPDADITVAQLPSGDVVTAFRKGSSVELSRWSSAGNGPLTLLSSGIKAGAATSAGIQPVSGSMFLTASTDPDGALVVKSWRLSDGSGLVNLATYRDQTRAFTQVAIAGPLNTDVYNGHRAATVAAAGGGIVHDVWGVDDGTGAIVRLGELFENVAKSNVAISPLPVETVAPGELFPPVYYASASWEDGGNASIRYYRIDAGGTPVKEGQATVSATSAYDVRVAPLGVSGVITSARDDDGDNEVELSVYEARRNADDTIASDFIVSHSAGVMWSPDLCRVPSAHAEGDYVLASTDTVGGDLRLRAYRSGDRPY